MKATESPEIDNETYLLKEVEPLGYLVLFRLNTLCNFRCEYCTQRSVDGRESPEVGRYDPQHIAKCFDDTGRTWAITMSGGEPFLYPRFVELASALTEKHYIRIFTNLATKHVYEFADVVPPQRVAVINAAYHIVERERQKGVSDYIRKVLHLQNRGFNIRVVYVLYPPLLPRLAGDIDYLKSHGVGDILLQAHLGLYRGECYPESYTDEEKRLIFDIASGRCEVLWDVLTLNTFGRLCSAGQKSFLMEPSGRLIRCDGTPRVYGNLFTGSYRLDKLPRPCPVQTCFCRFAHLEKHEGSASSVWKEKMLHRAKLRYSVARKDEMNMAVAVALRQRKQG